MSDPLFDDVKELLDKEKGDERILKQILRACENNEVVSNYERNYVRKLAEKHLGRKPLVEEKPSVPESTPDVILPETNVIPKPQVLQTEPKRTTKTINKNSKKMLAIGGVALAVIIIIAVASTGISDIPTKTDITKPTTTATTASFTVETDSNSYLKKDIISISGKSKTTGTINLSIENQDGTLIWSEQVKTKSDGRFSTLAIAGGSGWDKSGTFTLKAENDSEMITKSFSFKV